MFKNLSEILEKAKSKNKKTICISVAQDKDILEAVKEASKIDLANFILVGDKELINTCLKEIDFVDSQLEIIDEKDEQMALKKSVEIVANNKAQILMKGFVNTSNFLKAVLNDGMRGENLLSHLAAYEIPNTKKITFHTDTGMNVLPDLNQKTQILSNALLALKNLGIENPKVAVLAANEQVSPKIISTVDAAEIVKLSKENKFSSMIVEGPIAMDVALNPEAAKHKGITSEITGDVDLFLYPSIEAGNIMGKTLIYYTKAKMAGVILGATSPIVLTSRAESSRSKLNSMALACSIAD